MCSEQHLSTNAFAKYSVCISAWHFLHIGQAALALWKTVQIVCTVPCGLHGYIPQAIQCEGLCDLLMTSRKTS